MPCGMYLCVCVCVCVLNRYCSVGHHALIEHNMNTVIVQCASTCESCMESLLDAKK